MSAIEMARQIASAHYRQRARDPRNGYGHEIAHADRIDAGLSDDWDCVQTALAAIMQTAGARGVLRRLIEEDPAHPLAEDARNIIKRASVGS